MTNEAAIIELAGQPKGVPISYNVEGTVGVEKGTLMKISGADVKGAEASIDEGAIAFAGIASTEKDAADTAGTTLGLWTKGEFDILCSGVVVTGSLVALSGANTVASATAANILSGAIVGKALETGATGDVIQVAVGIYS